MPTDSNYISIPELIAAARAAGFDFGRGNPNNRLRYYTKIGLIPHAIRKQADKSHSFTSGYYPAETLDLLLKIQGLQQSGVKTSTLRERMTSSEPLSPVVEDFSLPQAPSLTDISSYLERVEGKAQAQVQKMDLAMNDYKAAGVGWNININKVAELGSLGFVAFLFSMGSLLLAARLLVPPTSQQFNLTQQQVMEAKQEVLSASDFTEETEVTNNTEKSEERVTQGHLIFKSGQTEVFLPQDWEELPKSIVITPTFKSQVWIKDLGTGGFTVSVDQAPSEEGKVFWQARW